MGWIFSIFAHDLDVTKISQKSIRYKQVIFHFLKGEIEDRLHNIESQMADQLNVIKTMILNIEDKLAQQDVQYRRANRKLHGAVAELSESVQSCSNLQQPGNFQVILKLIYVFWSLIYFRLIICCWIFNYLRMWIRNKGTRRKRQMRTCQVTN